MLATTLAYISGLLTLLVLDGVMIWFVILPTFKKYIPTYLNADMNFVAAIAFYLLYILILLVLIVLPGIDSKLSLLQILTKSALFGFGAYMTYELTSMSVIKGWNWNMVFIDSLWGTILTAIIGVVMYQVYKFFI
ncbi:DUF2177 family protein [Candidatus Gracilibacteria bacterium]|nr:DUF2177 family protein [Candidatus Gracilibacteria bacterium]